jgi:molybdopterin-guanine dinucleotide biosynthesis protein MobB
MCCHSKAKLQPARIFVCGASNSGKTTLIEMLIPRLRACGLRVATIKHAHHGFELDHPGKDSWRHAQAGSAAVAIIGPTRAAWLIETEKELSPHEAAKRLGVEVDVVLIEGFKCSRAPAIMVAPGAGLRLTTHASRCQIGVSPDQLTDEELEQLVLFCARQTRQRARLTPRAKR